MATYPDVVFASGPTYYSGTTHLLMPFTYSSGKLDLPSFINSGGFTSGGTDTLGNAGATVRRLGGTPNQVLTLGTNLQAFIKNRTWDGYRISGTLTVASPGIVSRVQQLSSKYLAPTWDVKSYNVSPNAWDFNNFIGQPTVYLFDKPLVIQGTGTKGTFTGPTCITFQTSWDH